ncbi:hypothetical protein M422DRAFT_46104 [Sphaerobolus stellatus SS14]|uniref:Uncharacterized protein n=1 Tax=Sphaerobolus stellatus (strain SS14) TaxID=990650 RepID=A0A0C9VHI7_SPHS4|nr:hypothetical protein M422DRAFT_46104 [Sphaerobolus stellatus SS14]
MPPNNQTEEKEQPDAPKSTHPTPQQKITRLVGRISKPLISLKETQKIKKQKRNKKETAGPKQFPTGTNPVRKVRKRPQTKPQPTPSKAPHSPHSATAPHSAKTRQYYKTPHTRSRSQEEERASRPIREKRKAQKKTLEKTHDNTHRCAKTRIGAHRKICHKKSTTQASGGT